MIRRFFAVELAGAALREALPLLRALADAMDPAGSAVQAWDRPRVPDYVPEAFTWEMR